MCMYLYTHNYTLSPLPHHAHTMHSTELGRAPRVKTCANLMRQMCYNNKDNLMAGMCICVCIPIPIPISISIPILGMICGGWDPYEGGQIFEIPLGGTMMPQRYVLCMVWSKCMSP
ncbi:hypothetical protein EON63_22220 [archaeon]|nr:MAG: hypothetical protein EON63_22220 [archaeon]